MPSWLQPAHLLEQQTGQHAYIPSSWIMHCNVFSESLPLCLSPFLVVSSLLCANWVWVARPSTVRRCSAGVAGSGCTTLSPCTHLHTNGAFRVLVKKRRVVMAIEPIMAVGPDIWADWHLHRSESLLPWPWVTPTRVVTCNIVLAILKQSVTAFHMQVQWLQQSVEKAVCLSRGLFAELCRVARVLATQSAVLSVRVLTWAAL